MRLGLSLSGGGFRATLFHLGVVRFLRDAGLLREVSDIVSVSGGSILAAHLALNWDKYNSTEQDFDSAAAEILRFVSLDIRNRIVRRIPFQLPLRWLSSLARRGFNRGLTVNGLMEGYLNRYLYHGRCVHELPVTPQLHILTTNVSEGGLCSFNRSGVHLQHRSVGEPDRVETVPVQLAPIAMAVAASAAFPGFFPPVQIRASDVGAQEGQFPTQTLTDGGVYDNLGVRAYYWIRKLWTERSLTVKAPDLDRRALAALGRADESSPPALRWLAAHLPEPVRAALSQSPKPQPETVAEVTAALGNLLKFHHFQQEPAFEAVALEEPAATLVKRARGGESLEPGWQAWLNRHLLASALVQASGGEALPTLPPGFDEVLVSDAGQPFLVLEDANLGFFAQSVRATDIMWDRVWQLERDNFDKDPLFRFITIHQSVSRQEDPTALHPVIQTEVPMIRTDLDRFSELESRALVMHGYEVARSACSHRLTESNAARALPPWNPNAPTNGDTPAATSGSQETADARALRRSARRRVWSTLFDWRDWPTYVFVPLLVFVFGVLPLLGWRFYERSRRNATIVHAVAQGMPDFRKAMELIDGDPVRGWKANPTEKVAALKEVNYQGWELLNDTGILDLREFEPKRWWRRTSPHYFYSNVLRVRKLPGYRGDGRLTLVYQFRGPAPEVRVRSPEFHAEVKQLDGAVQVHGQTGSLTHIELNLSHLPHGDSASVECEFLFRDVSHVKGYWVRYQPRMPTKMSNVWLLFPSSHPYRDYKLRSFVAGQPDAPESEEPRYLIDHPFGLVIAWSMADPKQERIYECQWSYEK